MSPTTRVATATAPKCQGAGRQGTGWPPAQAELLPVPYYHLVFTLPAEIARIAYQNKAHVYGILFTAASQTLLTIAADPKHLGAKIGITAVLHTWGSAMTHHPPCPLHRARRRYLSLATGEEGRNPQQGHKNTERWISCRPGFFLPVRVLSRLFRRLFLEKLTAAHDDGSLQFFSDHLGLVDRDRFAAFLAPLRKNRMGGLRQAPLRRPQGGARLSVALHTHRVAISNSRLIASDDHRVTFGWKD